MISGWGRERKDIFARRSRTGYPLAGEKRVDNGIDRGGKDSNDSAIRSCGFDGFFVFESSKNNRAKKYMAIDRDLEACIRNP